jgi:Fe-S cluster biogenesis protein NfuA
VSWLDRLLAGWKADEERALPRGDPDQVRDVSVILDEMAPMFAADGGEVRLVAVEDGWVVVELRGACHGCASSELSLNGALEPKLRERLAWVRGVRRS